MLIGGMVQDATACLGFQTLKGGEEVDPTFVEGKDVHVSVALPTGYGKSLCYCCHSTKFCILYE